MPNLFGDKTRAKEFLGVSQKPQTAVTSWVNRICEPADSVTDTDINQFIVELADVINLQPTGPEEASRAIRKQLKHGSVSQQKKALSLLESLVLNGGPKFQTTFADDRMVDCIKLMVYDPRTDQTVRRQTMIMLSYWSKHFKSDPKMSTVSGLYMICGGNHKLGRIQRSSSSSAHESKNMIDSMIQDIEKETDNSNSNSLIIKPDDKKSKKKIKDVKQRKKIKSPIEDRFRTHLPDSFKSPKFNLEKEAPNILKVVATAAQSANNLVNRLQLLDPVKNDVLLDAKVQAILDRTKQVQKSLIRYIRTVADHDENGEYMGTLLNTNAQVVAALELYELLADPSKTPEELETTTSQLKKITLKQALQSPTGQSEPSLFDDPLIPLSPLSLSDGPSSHTNQHQEDLLGLDFGNHENLPLPILPDSFSRSTGNHRQQGNQGGKDYDPGSLSDFSDFDSGSEEGQEFEPTPTDIQHSGISSSTSTGSKNVQLTGSGKVVAGGTTIHKEEEDVNNPFADPFF